MLQPPSLQPPRREAGGRILSRRFEVSHPSMWAHKWFVMIPTITVNMAHVAQSLCLCVRVCLLFSSDFLRQMDQTKMAMVSYLRTNTLQSTSLLTVYPSVGVSFKKQVVLWSYHINCYGLSTIHTQSKSVHVNIN